MPTRGQISYSSSQDFSSLGSEQWYIANPSNKLNPYHCLHLISRTVVTIVQSVRSLVDVGSIHLYYYIHCNSERFWIFLCYFYHQWLWKNSSLNPDGKHIVFAYEVWPCIVHGKDDFFSLEARMQIIFQTDTWNNKCTGYLLVSYSFSNLNNQNVK